MIEYDDYMKIKNLDGEKVHCINTLDDVPNNVFEQGKCYTISKIMTSFLDRTGMLNKDGSNITDMNIRVCFKNEEYFVFGYADFLEHFEPITITELRQRKIKSILE